MNILRAKRYNERDSVDIRKSQPCDSTNSSNIMDSNSWEKKNSVKASHEIIRILRNLKVYYHIPYPEPYQSSPGPHSTSWRATWILSFHLSLIVPSRLFPSGFLLCMNFSSPQYVPHALLSHSSWFHHPNSRQLVILICALSTLCDFTHICQVQINIQDPLYWLLHPTPNEFPFYFKIKCSLIQQN